MDKSSFKNGDKIPIELINFKPESVFQEGRLYTSDNYSKGSPIIRLGKQGELFLEINDEYDSNDYDVLWLNKRTWYSTAYSNLGEIWIDNMEKQIFYKGDKVYHYELGWGIVEEVTNDVLGYPVAVRFGERVIVFSMDGRYEHIQKPTLSFTEYDFGKGKFSQERPASSDIGKWGKFWDYTEKECVIDQLSSKHNGLYRCEMGWDWENFEPLTNEQIKTLELL